ncbi:MAG: basic amino acid ABC transporter substrate-binding protein [Firmicutes bacterium]|mgnify:CR=1 FL=1|nr:basic amino acid ABC transporter substrate-binding protein [Bacillota bacterium]
MKKTTALLITLLMMFAVTSTVLAQDVLKVATEAGFMPFEFVAEDGQLTGFDMDIIKAIGDKLGMKVQIDNISWDGLIPALQNKVYDALIAGITITPERAESVSFSDPYFESVLTIVVNQNNKDITSLDSLKGKIAAVQISTTGDFAAEEIEGLGSLLRYNTVPEAMQNVIMGTVHAMVVDLPVAEAYLAANPHAPLTHVGPVADNEFYGIAVHKENQELLAKINQALAEIKADGTYDAIYEKWFGAN